MFTDRERKREKERKRERERERDLTPGSSDLVISVLV